MIVSASSSPLHSLILFFYFFLYYCYQNWDYLTQEIRPCLVSTFYLSCQCQCQCHCKYHHPSPFQAPYSTRYFLFLFLFNLQTLFHQPLLIFLYVMLLFICLELCLYIVVYSSKSGENSGSNYLCLNSKLFIQLIIILNRAYQKPELDGVLQDHVQDQLFCNPICSFFTQTLLLCLFFKTRL